MYKERRVKKKERFEFGEYICKLTRAYSRVKIDKERIQGLDSNTVAIALTLTRRRGRGKRVNFQLKTP